MQMSHDHIQVFRTQHIIHPGQASPHAAFTKYVLAVMDGRGTLATGERTGSLTSARPPEQARSRSRYLQHLS